MKRIVVALPALLFAIAAGAQPAVPPGPGDAAQAAIAGQLGQALSISAAETARAKAQTEFLAQQLKAAQDIAAKEPERQAAAVTAAIAKQKADDAAKPAEVPAAVKPRNAAE